MFTLLLPAEKRARQPLPLRPRVVMWSNMSRALAGSGEPEPKPILHVMMSAPRGSGGGKLRLRLRAFRPAAQTYIWWIAASPDGKMRPMRRAFGAAPATPLPTAALGGLFANAPATPAHATP